MDTANFFKALDERARRDTSVVSSLRRSLAEDPGTFSAVYPWIEPWVGHLSERSRRMVYLAAGLWALAERRTQGPTRPLVDAIRQVARARDSASVEMRFTALLDADDDELGWRLRHLVQLLASDGVAIDWPALLEDLFSWNHPGRRVQQRWARGFWQADGSAASPAEGAPASE